MATALGAYLDPLADKALIVSIYVALGDHRRDPALARDPGGVARHHDRQRRYPVLAGRQADEDQAALVSKLNTVAQIALALLVLASLGFEFSANAAITALMALVAVLTLLSVAFYLAEWVRHMNEPEPRS